LGDLLGDASRRTPEETESAYAAILAEVLEVDFVSRNAHFFGTLGADSLVMAHFCARVRKRTDLTPVSMKDIYQCPTIESLVAAHPAAAPPSLPPSVPLSEPVPAQPVAWRAAGSTAYVACAILRLLISLGYCCVLAGRSRTSGCTTSLRRASRASVVTWRNPVREVGSPTIAAPRS
jgi:acyl carrier protein